MKVITHGLFKRRYLRLPYLRRLMVVSLAALINYGLFAQKLSIYTSGFGEMSEEIKKQAEFYVQHLAIKPERPMILMLSSARQLPEGISGLMDYEVNEITGSDNVIIKLREGLSGKRLGQTVAHELIHLKQYTEGQLEKIGGKLLRWKGQLIFDAYKIPYRQRKWEIEAFDREKALYKMYLRAAAQG